MRLPTRVMMSLVLLMAGGTFLHDVHETAEKGVTE
jgi:hypothetical protein